MAHEVDLSGTVLAGRYRITERIGGGGMGTVYAGEHVEMGRKLAIKVLRPDVTLRPTLVERFKREARAASSIDHENIVDCIDVGSTEAGLIYYVMEQLRGEDLHQRLRREKTQPWPRARAIALQICRALTAAHDKGIVHRDLKPGNIFLVQRGDSPDFVKLLDFGIAKITEPGAEDDSDALTALGEVIGTTPYMAPEQAAGEAIDHRIDVYATGVIVFQMLSGRLPFPGKTPRQVLTAILTSELPALAARNPALQASPALEALLRRCMHRDRDQRFPDMPALHAALARLPDDACQLVDAVPLPGASADELPTSIASIDLQFSELVAAAEANTQNPQVAPGSSSSSRSAPAPLLPAPASPRPRGRARLLATAGLAVAAIVLWVAVPRDSSPPGLADTREPQPTAATPGPLVPPAASPPNPVAATPVVVATPTPAEPVVVATPTPAEPVEATPTADPPRAEPPRAEAPRDLKAVIRQARARVHTCLARNGVMVGDSVRFDLVVAARTGKIREATPRGLHRDRPALGACVVTATQSTPVRPAPTVDQPGSAEFSP